MGREKRFFKPSDRQPSGLLSAFHLRCGFFLHISFQPFQIGNPTRLLKMIDFKLFLKERLMCYSYNLIYYRESKEGTLMGGLMYIWLM